MNPNTHCQELKNIQYKTMLLNGENKNFVHDVISEADNKKLDDFLEKEKTMNKNITWSRLNRSSKFSKLSAYSIKYSLDNNLSTSQQKLLEKYLHRAIDRKNLLKTKDVDYDKLSEEIINIPSLIFNNNTKKFTLKRCEKRASTLNSLGPGKNTRKRRK